jgi:hypothetical protein
LHYVPLNTHTKHLYLRNIFQNIPQCPEDIKRYVKYHISHNNIQQHTTTYNNIQQHNSIPSLY